MLEASLILIKATIIVWAAKRCGAAQQSQNIVAAVVWMRQICRFSAKSSQNRVTEVPTPPLSLQYHLVLT